MRTTAEEWLREVPQGASSRVGVALVHTAPRQPKATALLTNTPAIWLRQTQLRDSYSDPAGRLESHPVDAGDVLPPTPSTGRTPRR
jgi:hypothetical protein